VAVAFEKNMTTRVHTELKFGPTTDEAFDVVVLEERSEDKPYEVEYKSSGQIRNFRPPFFMGIEVKKADTFRYFSANNKAISDDIEKLAMCDLQQRYVAIIDFDPSRKEDKNKKLQELNDLAVVKDVKVFYAGLERFGFLPELIS
jgi:hypothetical protein